jgi:hypothetical protein
MMGRPSSVPVTLGSIVGCEGGAATGGRVEGSTPSSAGAPSGEVCGGGSVCGITVVEGGGSESLVACGAGCGVG